MHTYVEFAESSIIVFAQSARLVDLERAHGELVRSLMTHLERVASQSVKTPREVVQLGNFFGHYWPTRTPDVVLFVLFPVSTPNAVQIGILGINPAIVFSCNPSS